MTIHLEPYNTWYLRCTFLEHYVAKSSQIFSAGNDEQEVRYYDRKAQCQRCHTAVQFDPIISKTTSDSTPSIYQPSFTITNEKWLPSVLPSLSPPESACRILWLTHTHTHTNTHTHTKYGFLWTFNTCVDCLRFMHHCSAAADLTCEDQKELQECGVRLEQPSAKWGPRAHAPLLPLQRGPLSNFRNTKHKDMKLNE